MTEEEFNNLLRNCSTSYRYLNESQTIRELQNETDVLWCIMTDEFTRIRTQINSITNPNVQEELNDVINKINSFESFINIMQRENITVLLHKLKRFDDERNNRQ